MPETPFAQDDGLPDFDPRQAAKDMQLQRMHQQVQDNPWALGSSAGPPAGSPRHFVEKPGWMPRDKLEPVYEALSPSQQGYGLGQAAGNIAKHLQHGHLMDAALEVAPLVASMAIPGAPKGARGVKVRPEIPRELDSLGYYSQALEAAKAWPQPKGTPEQVLAALKQAGVKDAEIKATNLQALLEGKPQVTREELVQHLRDNRVQLQEGKYGNADSERLQEYIGRHYDGAELEDLPRDVQRINRQQVAQQQGLKGEPKWADYSLDPSNPSYRESVLHLPDREHSPYLMHDETGKEIGRYPNRDAAFEAYRQKYNYGTGSTPLPGTGIRPIHQSWPDFKQGHYPEPNVMAHMRTSVQKDAQGKPVFLVDELQSDWGQKLRDGGARDEAKIAAIEKARDDAYQQREALAQEAHALATSAGIDAPKHYLRKNGTLDIPNVHTVMDWLRRDPKKYGKEPSLKAAELVERMDEAVKLEKLKEAELATARAATPGHPLVNTTDQWTTTAMRRLLQQASESGAEGLAITPGQLQNERFNLSKQVEALAYDPGRESLLYRRPGESVWSSSSREVPAANLHEHIGREMAEKLLAQPISQFEPGTGGGYSQGAHMLHDLGNVEIGGSGMRYAYDQMYPKQLEKMLRKLDPQHPGRGETRLVPEGGQEWDSSQGNRTPFHYFPLTPRVKEEVAKGLPLFSSAALMALVPQVQQAKPELHEDNPFGYDQ